MTNESRREFNKPSVFGVCEQLGEAGVLADLERAGIKFTTSEQKFHAWEWIYIQRMKREDENSKAIRDTAHQTMYVAIGTAIIALATAITSVVSLWLK